ncbi:multisubunit sodium/proton antiporter, MrpD subunit [Maricaulis maris MCS10]|jgi:multicomponent Na+:H+ antiporter subunit D|uniref:Multisubunit sodium/proton antiporter, MrpD subunit n=1 Tax=Maricaulis maris (strain MCS10) TaxID=394221 RepID=Q0ARA4_MARMM|nr:monovalent cation/H+ antiporter subunit D family protein [Maricaulis maris]ABI65183.1 multisubunit sodium/proton antiporter, MrpD subunit [Maricaulis maris MCS10]
MQFLADFLPAGIAMHAPALIVVIPLIMAAVSALMPNGRLGWLVTLITSALVAVLALNLLGQVATQDVISYHLGGWAPPLGIEYRVDMLNIPLLLVVGIVGFLCVIYALPSVADEIAENKQALFYSAFLVCFAGLLGVTITGDAFNVFVFLEISSISTYVIIAMGAGKDRRALTASYNYLILGTIGATFFVIGVGFLYMATGTLNMADMAAILEETGHNRVTQAAFAFIVVGLGLKAAMFPLHLWLPNAYAFAPNFVTAFLASTATKVAFYALIRFLFSVFHPDVSFVSMSFTWLFAVVGTIAMVVASLQAVFQTDARRLLAYSSVAQVGYMMLGLGMGTASGLSAGLLHLMNHALMKGALFMALGAFALNFGVRRVKDLAGMSKTMPASATAFTIAGLSLVGVPLTVGFTSKWYLVTAALERGWWWAVAALMLSSLLALAYVARLLSAIWMDAPPSHHGELMQRRLAPWMVLVPMSFLALANVYFFFHADPLVWLARSAAEAVMGGN